MTSDESIQHSEFRIQHSALSIKVLNRFPGANAAVLATDDRAHEAVFAPEPRPGPDALWFHLRVADPQPPAPPPAALRVRLAFADAFPGGAAAAAALRPVYRTRGGNWQRTKAATALPPPAPETPASVVWEIPYPEREGATDFALDYPYGPEDLASTLRRSGSFWTETPVGLFAGGAALRRLSSGQPPSPAPRALYLVARRAPAAAPSAWVLDGMLEAFSRAHSAKWRVWAVPLADPAGAERGASGGDPAALARLRALLAADLGRWAAGSRPELLLDLDAAAPGGPDGAALVVPPAADPAAEKSAQAWANLFRQALAPDFAAEDFAAAGPLPEGLPPPPASAPALPFLSLRVPFGRIRGAQASPRQYREIGQRVARAILSRW